MSDKFIPNGDLDFAMMAEFFARNIAGHPERFKVSSLDAEALSLAVVAYRAALTAARESGRSAVTTRAKDEAREVAERMVRRVANGIRMMEGLDATSRVMLGLRERPRKMKQQPCPVEPPQLRFVRALHQGGATPRHELAFSEMHRRNSKKPAGAVRLELFVDLIPVGEAIPGHPGANHGGRPWYLRSFTRSPIVLAPPMTRVPMRVVYWGRWADSTGNVGPFSATAVAWIEGGSGHQLPGSTAMQFGLNKPTPMFEEMAAVAGRDQTISVVVLEAQYQSFHSQQIVEAAGQLEGMPAREARRLEGKGVEEAA